MEFSEIARKYLNDAAADGRLVLSGGGVIFGAECAATPDGQLGFRITNSGVSLSWETPVWERFELIDGGRVVLGITIGGSAFGRLARTYRRCLIWLHLKMLKAKPA